MAEKKEKKNNTEYPDPARDIAEAYGHKAALPDEIMPEAASDKASGAEGSGEPQDEAQDLRRGSDTDPERAPSDAELLAAEHDSLLRLAAEYENFRRRTAEERRALYNDVKAETAAKFLPVFDNLSRAESSPCGDENYAKGVAMTLTGLCSVFEALGVTAIPAVGEKFNPNRHNAVMHIESSEFGEQIITEELQRGFELNGKVIRHALVTVAN